MPRTTAFLVEEFSDRLDDARDFARAVEGSSTFLYTRRLYVYEAAYLLAFSAWENFLEQVFLRFLCGFANKSGSPAHAGHWSIQKSIAAASVLVLQKRRFLLWHNPQDVIDRSKRYLQIGPHEAVLQSALTEIEDFAAIRHYIAHRNHDTAVKFQAAATRLTGAPIHGGRAGRLLRDQTIDPVTGAQTNWLERIGADLKRYAKQIAK